ncbi:MAG: alanine racemase [Cryomorphaceae bacterium]|nr:MAG: alanine racemase [Cryomorphaceae bacterium]
MFEPSYIELSQKALLNNLRFLRKRVGPDVRISSVVKGNAYGHGIESFVPMLCAAGVDHFSVFSASEAERVRQACSCRHDIMIMGEVDGEALDWAISEDIEFFVFDKHRLERAIEIAQNQNRCARIHIELETGMNRTGFEKSELEWVADMLRKHSEHLHFRGLCTHYAGAESIANYLRIQRQMKRYREGLIFFKSQGLIPDIKHTCCSAAMMMFPRNRYDMVRVGIMQYGFWPSAEIFVKYVMGRKNRQDPLKRVISWKSHVMAIKDVSPGEFIGYGQSYQARENMRTAVIPVGYSHGYTRELSNQGRLLIRGCRVGVVGIVNMNMLLVDITEVPDAEVGDEAVLIGYQGDMEITVASFGELTNQLNYELLTRLPHHLPRKPTE